MFGVGQKLSKPLVRRGELTDESGTGRIITHILRERDRRSREESRQTASEGLHDRKLGVIEVHLSLRAWDAMA